jgi:hypothetical protein
MVEKELMPYRDESKAIQFQTLSQPALKLACAREHFTLKTTAHAHKDDAI